MGSEICVSCPLMEAHSLLVLCVGVVFVKGWRRRLEFGYNFDYVIPSHIIVNDRFSSLGYVLSIWINGSLNWRLCWQGSYGLRFDQ